MDFKFEGMQWVLTKTKNKMYEQSILMEKYVTVC